jgi:hypothetical protein
VSGASINRRLREATDKLKLHASCAVLRVIIDQFASLSEITDNTSGRAAEMTVA